MRPLRDIPREVLEGMLVDFARNWLAHDGVWFQAVEEARGLEEAIRLDTRAWERFAAIEARRIMARHGIREGGGVKALATALDLRMYSCLNDQVVTVVDERTCLLEMLGCRVQEARAGKGLPDFGCHSVGEVEFASFARAVDPRIETRCAHCPPDPRQPGGQWCSWEFTLRPGRG